MGIVAESQFDEEYPFVAYPLIPLLPACIIGGGGGGGRQRRRRRHHRRDVPRGDLIAMDGRPGVVGYVEQCRGAMRAMAE